MNKDHIIKFRVSEEERKILEEESEGSTISEVIRGRLFSETRVYFYRHFNVGEELLYVGVTENLKRRNYEHKMKSSWYDEVATTKVRIFFSRILAEEAEKKAIQTENPKYNIRDSICEEEKLTSVSFTVSQVEALDEESIKRGISKRKLIRELVEAWIKKENK